MPVFLEEDGTGVLNATSYVSVAYSEDYLSADWANDQPAKESALMVAAEYIDARWGMIINGRPLSVDQGLEFPRLGLVDRYGRTVAGIPNDLKNAACIYASEQVAGTLYPNPSSKSAQDVKRKKTTVGPITTEVEYQGSQTDASFLEFTLADKFIRPYCRTGGGVIR